MPISDVVVSGQMAENGRVQEGKAMYRGGASEQPDQGSGGSDGTPLHCTGSADRASPQGRASPPSCP